ncbi:unnamed protein product [Toxocara canis]|uniref:Reverse transcriptase domain-containing protein n=1 Tax=Toxocara canis TaxID=6265 RepID=A0A183TZB3_TOXCA|nr:unnamed protein product [Toxocara canis]
MLLCAEDVVLIAGNLQALQDCLNELDSNAKTIGLKIDSSKTQWMKNVLLWIAFAKLSDILIGRKTPPPVKAALFNSTILLVLLYGCETWNTTLAEERKLAVTQRALERRTVGIRRLQHIPNEDLRSRYGVKDFFEMMYAKKHTWDDHMAEMNNNKWTERTVEWCPRNVRRKPGRPPLRWRGSLVRVHGSTWMRQAHDRGGCCRLHGWKMNRRGRSSLKYPEAVVAHQNPAQFEYYFQMLRIPKKSDTATLSEPKFKAGPPLSVVCIMFCK